jgi:SAM-dependent methyltransferase
LEAFWLQWNNDCQNNEDVEDCSFDIILAADIIYVSEIIVPLTETVQRLLAPTGVFLLAYARRNVPVDLVHDQATRCGFE